jgi:hypothetical protein
MLRLPNRAGGAKNVALEETTHCNSVFFIFGSGNSQINHFLICSRNEFQTTQKEAKKVQKDASSDLRQ